MENNFDLNKIGKRMPYTVPDDFFDTLEHNVWQAVNAPTTPQKSKHKKWLWPIISGLVAAVACVALVLVLRPLNTAQPQDDFAGVANSFAQLSQDDQNYLLEVYQDEEMYYDETDSI